MDENLETESGDLSKLLDQLREQFEIADEQFSFGSHNIRLYRPADPESILDDETLIKPYQELQWQPYWAQAWDASVGMCHYLADQPLESRSVLDLGCGIGLTSALLAAAGAIVTCGDNAPPSLTFAKANTWPWRRRTIVQLIDWHKTVLPDSYELIVGSDIVYDRIEVAPLDRFFRRHLRTDGQVLLGDPSRPMTREYLEMFRQLGWKLSEETRQVKTLRNPIRIVKMRQG